MPLSLKFSLRQQMAMVLVFALFASIGSWYWRASQRGWTVSKLERLIQAEVPLGCNRPFVETWLDRQGITHSYFPGPSRDRRGKQTMPEIAGLDPSKVNETVRGEIGVSEANVSVVFSGTISIYFFFDAKGRLIGSLVDPFVYEL